MSRRERTRRGREKDGQQKEKGNCLLAEAVTLRVGESFFEKMRGKWTAFVGQSPTISCTSHKGGPNDCGKFRKTSRRKRAIVRKRATALDDACGIAGGIVLQKV